jgi:polyisoprenoid-binding protein YceI
MDLLIGLAVAILAAPAAAPPLQVSRGEVLFVAHASLGMRIEGKTVDLAAVSGPDAVEFRVQLATLETGIALRDRHMRDDYLQVQNYPVALLRILRERLPSPAAPASGTCQGELTLHGRTHPVNVVFQVKRAAGYEVSATMHLDLRDYDIPSPRYLGVSVKPDVDVSVDFHLDSP